MIEMTLEIAEKALRAAQGKSKALGSPMSVTIVDEAGRLVLAARGDGTGFFSTDTSRAKAVAAAAFKRPNSELAPLVAKAGSGRSSRRSCMDRSCRRSGVRPSSAAGG
jgi:uncharacterized protein GlcG (DUF336 family)